MVPVCDEDGPEVLIVVGRGRAVDYQRPVQPIAVLKAEVAVVPGGAVLVGVEIVRHARPGCDGALRDPGCPVVRVVVELPYTVPVDGRAVGRNVVGHVDDDVVAPVGCDCWARHGPVGRQAFPLIPVWCAVDLLESQPVLDCAVRVKDRVVVVGVDVVLAPALAGRRAVLASAGQVAGVAATIIPMEAIAD